MKRRDFIRQTITGAAVLGVSPVLLRGCTTSDPLHDFGIISGVIKNELSEDPRGTLTKIAEMGYKYLEGGGTYGMSTGEYNAFMAEIGLKTIAGGTNIAGLQGDKLKKIIDDSLAVDKKYVVCYWPWLKDPADYTIEDLKPVAEELNRIGEECKSNGIGFAYHNHDHEFTVAAGGMAYDFFLENTEAEYVTMQFDLYWASVGGVDPVDYIRKYPGRFEMLHVKDSYDLDERLSFACVGEGVIDFERIFHERHTGGFKYLIVEKDGATEGVRCAQASIDHLKSLDF